MRGEVDKQVRTSLDEAEARGACLQAYSEAAHKDLERRCDAGQLVSPLPGLYARGEYWEGLGPAQKALHKMRGLARLRPGWVFCGPSAALAYGLPVTYAFLDPLEVVGSRSGKRLCDGHVRSRHVPDEEADGVYHDGLWVTAPLRTVLDCGRTLPFCDAVAIADAALAGGLFTKEALLAYLDERRRGVGGVGRARDVARFADPRAGSGGESIARAAMWELGFAKPELQVPFDDPLDHAVYYVDFLWRLPDGRAIAGELDGGEKYVNQDMTGGASVAEVMRRERRRESRITASCDAVVRFSPADVADAERFNRLLEAFDVPKDHEPLVVAGAPREPRAPLDDQVPLDAYGI